MMSDSANSMSSDDESMVSAAEYPQDDDYVDQAELIRPEKRKPPSEEGGPGSKRRRYSRTEPDANSHDVVALRPLKKVNYANDAVIFSLEDELDRMEEASIRSSEDYSDDEIEGTRATFSVLNEREILRAANMTHADYADLVTRGESVDEARRLFSEYISEKIQPPLYLFDRVDIVDSPDNNIFDDIVHKVGSVDLAVTALLYKLYHQINAGSLELYFSDVVNNIMMAPKDLTDYMTVEIDEDDEDALAEAGIVIKEPILVKFTELREVNEYERHSLDRIRTWLESLSGRMDAYSDSLEMRRQFEEALERERLDFRVLLESTRRNLSDYQEQYKAAFDRLEMLDKAAETQNPDTLQGDLNDALERIDVLESMLENIELAAKDAIRDVDAEAPPESGGLMGRVSNVLSALKQSSRINDLARENEKLRAHVHNATRYVNMLDGRMQEIVHLLDRGFDIAEGSRMNVIGDLENSVKYAIDIHNRAIMENKAALASMRSRLKDMENKYIATSRQLDAREADLANASAVVESLTRKVQSLTSELEVMSKSTINNVTKSPEYIAKKRELEQYQSELRRVQASEYAATKLADSYQNDLMAAQEVIEKLKMDNGRLLAAMGEYAERRS